jgi:hypothetical protein
MEVPSVTFEVKDRVGDELSRAVPCGLSPAIDLENGMGESFLTAKARLISGAADCVNWLVFEKKKLLTSGAGEIRADQPVLEVERFLIFDAAKPLDFDWFHILIGQIVER